jgi:hypothetical protein
MSLENDRARLIRALQEDVDADLSWITGDSGLVAATRAMVRAGIPFPKQWSVSTLWKLLGWRKGQPKPRECHNGRSYVVAVRKTAETSHKAVPRKRQASVVSQSEFSAHSTPGFDKTLAEFVSQGQQVEGLRRVVIEFPLNGEAARATFEVVPEAIVFNTTVKVA